MQATGIFGRSKFTRVLRSKSRRLNWLDALIETNIPIADLQRTIGVLFRPLPLTSTGLRDGMICWQMAKIFPFEPYRYTSAAGPLPSLVTQPYDKISAEMQARYLSLSPYNLVRLILGERFPSDSDAHNVYTRASHDLNDWIAKGVLAQDEHPGFFAYFQEFTLPGSSERLTRKGFIGLGALEEYAAKIVHRHEQTLSGPKKDRTELLKHTLAHFGQIFMLYPDPAREIDAILDQAAQGEPLAVLNDEYGATHRLWKIADPASIARIQELMSDKKLLIADGHHRYETALAFRNANPQIEGARNVMMTFVNMHSPGLKILATHRVVNDVPGFSGDDLLANLQTRSLASLGELKEIFSKPAPEKIRIGIAVAGDARVHLVEREREPGELDVLVLHQELLGTALGIGEEAVREEKHLQYVRGLDAAWAKVADGEAQAAFLLEPTTARQVADIAFGGGVMPQKSTDFFPKLLSGLTIYKLE